MISVKFDNKKFKKDMNNLIAYSTGFTDGIQLGKKQMLDNLGQDVSFFAEEFIDANARLSPQTLHHVYEWYSTGSPNARLFDIKYTVSNLGVSFISSFKQSTTIQNGSREPFRNKAEIMESGMTVTIEPRNSQVLRFEDNGEIVYTKNAVTVENPGGNTEGQFEKVFDLFFGKYFTQAFLKTSGLLDHFSNPASYKLNLAVGMKAGRSSGVKAGYRWVANAKVSR